MATQQGGAEIRTDDKAPTITAAAGMSGNNQPIVALPDTLKTNAGADDCEGIGLHLYNFSVSGEVAVTLNANSGHSSNHAGPTVAVPYTLKIRSGCDGGGKGALVQTDKSATLATNNDQYLFQPVPNILLDDQGGQQVNVRTDGKSPTLRAEAHGNVPCVVESAGFKAGQGVKALGIRYEEERCPTLAAEAGGNSVPTVCIKETLPFDTTRVTSSQNWCNPKWGDPCHPLAAQGHPPAVVCKTWDARGNGDGETVSTLTGDHENRITDYTSVVCEPVPIHDQATRFSGKRGDKSDGKGNGLGVGNPGDPMNTLTAGDHHAVAYTMQGFGDYKDCGVASGLKARDYKDATDLVAEVQPVAIDRAFFNQGQNAKYDPQCYNDGTNPTLVARGPSAVAVRYIVRRLMPTECARLQGFADSWGEIDAKESFTEEEYRFWLDVRNTHAAINGKIVKDYTEKQMLTWYEKLRTDSAEYKMWGNGIALPPALYCMQGFADVLGGNAKCQ